MIIYVFHILKTAEDAKKCQKRLYLYMYFLLGKIPFNIKTLCEKYSATSQNLGSQ